MTALPLHGLELRSTLTSDGQVEIALVEVPLEPPGDDEVVIRVEAAPINPSDLISLLASADAAQARKVGNKTLIALSPEATAARKGRWDQSLAVGLEGAGTVVAAGAAARISWARELPRSRFRAACSPSTRRSRVPNAFRFPAT